ERQRADDHRAGARFRRIGKDLQLHLLAVAQELLEIVERLGEIAAGLALDRERDAHEGEFGEIDTAGGLPHHFFKRLTELDLIRDLTELEPDHALHLAADIDDRLGYRQAGAHAAHHQADRIG